MSRSFNARFKLEYGDYEALSDAYARLTRPRRFGRALHYVMLAVLAGFAAWMALEGKWLPAIYFVIIVAALLLLRHGVEPWARRRQFIHQRLGEYGVSFQADEEGLATTSELASGTYKWAMIRRVDDLPEHVLLWPNNRIGFIIPKRAFATPAEAKAFVELAMEKTAGQKL